VPISPQAEQAADCRPSCAHPEQRRRNNWKPGQSGNPWGKALGKVRLAVQIARRDELAAALATEFPDATAYDLALIRAAADLLERAEHKAANLASTRMANSAMRIIDRIRDARATRPLPTLPVMLEEYFAEEK
jgi:hypothetical protein